MIDCEIMLKTGSASGTKKPQICVECCDALACVKMNELGALLEQFTLVMALEASLPQDLLYAARLNGLQLTRNSIPNKFLRFLSIHVRYPTRYYIPITEVLA
ncbi:hypothetical protein OCU04_002903 [Sclerotinia nivalis]|uniref:Uncharacterized protein n=1 Tax=Sclerotinia nivalis TaxID=352851 RepID=A0A9X0AUL3_9HELO|nr:hypothetical protein OCU04_002903 [Sclerotinia nivalis]